MIMGAVHVEFGIAVSSVHGGNNYNRKGDVQMNCVVTGAAGFIGSHLCERLLEDGHCVVGMDNLSVGRLENLQDCARNEKFIFEHCDIADQGFSFDGIDWVFHLAARADVVPSIVDPIEYHRSNVTGTIRVLEACRKASVKRFVYSASSSCYGAEPRIPTSEFAEANPGYPYAMTKYIGEEYAIHWARVYGLPVTSLRLFNVYGPRGRTSGTYGAVFGVFLSQMAHGIPLTIVGDGKQQRDFTFVTDVVDAFVKAAEHNEAYWRVLNIGTGKPQSVLRLVELLGGQSVDHIPDRPGEPRVTMADIELAYRILNWKPVVSFEEGVQKMLGLIPQFKDAPLWTPDKIQEATRDWFKYLG